MAPVTAWRLVKTRYAATAFSGDGARQYGGRWNSVGVAVSYASGSAALATLEVMVGVQSSALLGTYSLCGVSFDDELVEDLPPDRLPADWRNHPPAPSTQAIGDSWAEAGHSLVLRVPSAVIPFEPNYLIRPTHPDIARLRVLAPEPYIFDPRLIGKAENP